MRRFLMTLSALTGLVLPMAAQQDDDSSRGVARVSVIAGDVSVRRGDSGDNVAATLNAPLVAQDRLLTGIGSRAELQFDFANMIRLGANTEIRLAELQYQRFQINLAVGLATFRVWQNSQSEVDINTPSASIRPMRKGEYRVQVLEDGSTEITVRDGEVDIFTPQGSRRLGQGRTLTVRREANGETGFLTAGEIPLDTWDRWNRDRDQQLASSRSNRYLPQGVFGGEQLDAYGEWVYAAPYGNVWRPRVAAGWAPYRVGRWSWLDWYGWSWVSQDPWGWAPYHYGRWFWNAGNWCWWPGAGGARHFWSPALVSFVGFGRGGFGVGFGFGNVGWVPLAPFETHNRWWGRGFYGNRNFNNVTVVNNVNITNVYRNARVDGGVSYVEAENFNRGIAHNGGNGGGFRAANRAELSSVGEFRGPLTIAPSRESVRFANQEGVRGNSSSFSIREDQRFTARREASAVDRVPFEQQRQNVEQMGRATAGLRAEDGVRGGNSAPGSDGFRRVGERDMNSAGTTRGSEGFIQRDSGIRGSNGNSSAEAGSDGFRRLGGDRNSEGYVNRTEGVRGNSGNNDSRSGWQNFGNAGVESRGRATNRSSDGFVQRDNSGDTGVRGGDRSSGRGAETMMDRGTFDSGSRSRGVGAVDVSPRVVERNQDSGSPRMQRQQQDSIGDPYGGGSNGGSRGNSRSDSGWGSFGGIRGGSDGGSRSPRMEQSAPRSMPEGMRGGGGGGSFGGFGRGGGNGGGGSAPQMSAPSGGGSRGGGATPSGGAGGGGGRGRGGNQ
jgi:hypothetical protein